MDTDQEDARESFCVVLVRACSHAAVSRLTAGSVVTLPLGHSLLYSNYVAACDADSPPRPPICPIAHLRRGAALLAASSTHWHENAKG